MNWRHWWAWAGMGWRLLRSNGPITSLRYAHYLLTASQNGRWEWWLHDVVPEHGRVAIDAGASFGQWTSLLAPRFASVVAFEPHNASWQRLFKHAPPNAAVLHRALWDAAAECVLYRYPDSRVNRMVGHDLEYTIGQPESIETVRASTLDSFNLAAVDFIKVDVEGAEAAVIRGAQATIRRSHPVLLIELHSQEARIEIERLLSELDYTQSYRHFPFYRPDNPLYWQRLWLVAKPPQGGSP